MLERSSLRATWSLWERICCERGSEEATARYRFYGEYGTTGTRLDQEGSCLIWEQSGQASLLEAALADTASRQGEWNYLGIPVSRSTSYESRYTYEGENGYATLGYGDE